MKVSELTAALQKVQQVAGDVEVVLRHLDQGAETVLKSIGVHINPASGTAGGQAVLEHDTAAEQPADTEKPADPLANTDAAPGA